MNKTQILAMTLVAGISSAVTIGTRELLAGRSDVVYMAHGMDLRRAQGSDVSPVVATSYVTALTSLSDGGLGLVDLNEHACPLTKEAQSCAKLLLTHGASEACR